MTRRRKRGWSYLTGERGRNRVRAYEHPVTGKLFLEVREDSKKRRIALGHRDREAAKVKADEVAAALARSDQPSTAPITLWQLFDNYLREVTPTKGLQKRAHDRRATALILEIVGPARHAVSLTHRHAARFVAERRRRGDLRKGRSLGRPLAARMLEYDVKFFQAVLNWGVNAGWLDRNPLKGFRVEREEGPRRPILTGPQYERLLAASGDISPLFRLALIIAHETGHRIGAVRQLRWSDIDLAEGTVHWRAEHDKIGHEHTTPLTKAAMEALQEVQRDYAAIGDAWVFPSPTDPAKPATRHLMRDWWERGEAAAGLKPERRRGWHSLRRKFATEMKATPLKDLCELGGWKDPQTVLKCYQRADPVTMRAALEQRGRLEA